MMRAKLFPLSVPRRLALLAGLMLLGTGCAIVSPPSPPPSGAHRPFDPHFTDLNYLLAHYVTPQGVDYAGLKTEQGRLEIALYQMLDVNQEQFQNWTRDSQLAFLINAFNAHALERVLRAWPVGSLSDTGHFGYAMRERNIRLLGREWSLNMLLDELMSLPYHDARAIFLVNWCAKDCAPLPPAAVNSMNLGDMLERQTRLVMADAHYYQYNSEKHIAYVSRLLGWYRDAFERDYGTLWGFLKKYLSPADVQKIALRPTGPRIRFLKFDDNLNASAPARPKAPAEK